MPILNHNRVALFISNNSKKNFLFKLHCVFDLSKLYVETLKKTNKTLDEKLKSKINDLICNTNANFALKINSKIKLQLMT